ncbi:DUF3566 domain-containing protein [Sphaerisporangium krabiense]|uniref:DUF3566 domain-containing protein n=1 Tax=Sphaerisporangium krabiense TaxID=763782 RepID=A0A7W8Z2Y0_9ACTN|nr:DUF3566 domain-containing protein [Sphaerisporangium krabiense]MBB5626441.1 hypothetical protein [Sphaerisporangium krabiense]
MTSDDAAAASAGDGQAGGKGGPAENESRDTMRIRSSSMPDNSWPSTPDGPGGGPTRPSQKPPSTPLPPTGSSPAGPRPAAGGPGGRGPGAPGPGGPASGPGGRPATTARPATGPADGGKPHGLGNVSALATPDPIVGRSEQRDGKPAPLKAPRKAHLVLRRIEPWSAMKFSFVVSLVCFVVLFVAVAVLYGVLSALGVFDSIVNTVTQLTVPDGKTSSGIDIKSWFEPVRILGYTALLGAVNVVLITALSTLGAVIYNVASDLVGGVEVTFSEAE